MSNSASDLRERAAEARSVAAQLEQDALELENLADQVESQLGKELTGAPVKHRGQPKPKAKTIASGEKRGRGRPPGSTNKPKEGKAEGKTEKSERAKQPALREVILDVLKANKGGADLATVVKGVLERGYVSTGDISQNVSTNLYNMRLKDHTVVHDKESHKYSFAKVA